MKPSGPIVEHPKKAPRSLREPPSDWTAPLKRQGRPEKVRQRGPENDTS